MAKMPMVSRALKPMWLHRTAAWMASLFCLALASSPGLGQEPGVGRVIGNIEGVSRDGEQFFLSGWACQQGQKQSIAVHVTIDNPASLGDPSKRSFAPGMANLDSEPAVAGACQDHGEGRHRFFIALPIGYDGESKVYAHGIRVVEGVANALLAGSGAPLARLPGLNAPFRVPPPPRISGAYHHVAEHPRVFTTALELRDAAARINRPGSYSQERFAQLAGDVTRDLASGIEWDATYSGCIGAVYQHAFSVERAAGVEDLVRANLKLAPSAKVPRGAAIVAARSALYAALVKAGAAAPAGAPSTDRAIALAKRILLAWAEHGFPRDANGRFRSLPALSCEQSGRVNLLGAAGPALMLGAVAQSVHAQDLLQYMGALDAAELRSLDAFHSAMFDIIRQSDNVHFGYGGIPFPAPPISRYTNIDAGALTSLLAIARLQDDERKFNAVLYGGDASAPVALPWWRFFDRAIYGRADSPLECGVSTIECSSNKDPVNSPGFQTGIVAPGEIVDRYRNEDRSKSFGYSMGLLRSLIEAAEILRLSGFDPYAYRGSHQQSIEMAIGYYACFAKGDGFYQTVTAEESGGCPDAGQYYGKIVNDVDRIVVFGADRFRENAGITALEPAARIASRTSPLDTILFGKWRD